MTAIICIIISSLMLDLIFLTQPAQFLNVPVVYDEISKIFISRATV